MLKPGMRRIVDDFMPLEGKHAPLMNIGGDRDYPHPEDIGLVLGRLSAQGQISTEKPIVVHLGNVGIYVGTHEGFAEKTTEYSARFPGVQFVGIDDAPYEGKVSENFTQYCGNYPEVLRKKFKDNSIRLISSELSLGHYDMLGDNPEMMDRVMESEKIMRVHDNTLDTLNAAYDKMAPGGQILLAVGRNFKQMMINAFDESQFENHTVRPFRAVDYERTFWTKQYTLLGEIYQMNAEKPKISSRQQ